MMKTRKISILMMAILFVGVVFTSCKNDDDVTPEPHNHEEEITRVSLVFTKVGASTSETYNYKVEEDAAKADKIMLDKNATYTVKFEVYNDEENENVTEEIQKEDDEHLICFTPSTTALKIQRTDKDENGKEVGLMSSWTTMDASTGKVEVNLRHQEGTIKSSQATENCNAGSTDAKVSFDYEIK